jgi:hypothetical protein
MMNQLAEIPFTVYVGIDWADAKHDICVQAAGSEDREFDRIVHKPEEIEVWAQALYQRFGGPIAARHTIRKRKARSNAGTKH